VRRVTIAHRLLMGEFEVTRGQFAQFFNESQYRTSAESTGKGCYGISNGSWKEDPAFNWKNMGFTQDDRHPVACVSWDDANAYIAWLNKKVGLTGAGAYRLPTESEWEYAARGVTRATDSLSANRKQHTRFYWGDDPGYSDICSYANVADKTAKETYSAWAGVADCADRYVYTAPVGSLGGASYAKPHPFGLKDMHGNVWEWTQDCYVDSYKDDSKTPLNGDKSIESAGCRRVLRGGSWNFIPGIARAAFRSGNAPDVRDNVIGFRISRTLF
jgi:formylglycine-generating enzyme required for sulfatase activity